MFHAKSEFVIPRRLSLDWKCNDNLAQRRPRSSAGRPADPLTWLNDDGDDDDDDADDDHDAPAIASVPVAWPASQPSATARARPIARSALTRWMSALATDDPFHPRNARSSTPPGHLLGRSGGLRPDGIKYRTEVEHSLEVNSLQHHLRFRYIVHCNSDLLYSFTLVNFVFRCSVGRSPARFCCFGGCHCGTIHQRQNVLWTPGAARDGRKDGRRGPEGKRGSERASEASFESTPIIPGIIYHLVG